MNHQLLFRFLFGPNLQTPAGTLGFFEWFFYGLGGIGGWLIFLLLAVIALIWLLYDSGRRRLPAIGWRTGVVVLAAFLLPAMIYRFTVTPMHFEIFNLLKLYGEDCPVDVIQQSYPEVAFVDCDSLLRSLPPMTPYGEIVFYLGLLGGILTPMLAVGYFITFQGLIGCSQGHTYEDHLGQCPDCNRPPEHIPSYQEPVYQQEPVQQQASRDRAAPIPPSKPKIPYAWLVDLSNNQRLDLCEGTTRLGRDPGFCDLVFDDSAISRKGHAAIIESKGHFRLKDIGSSHGTYLNRKKLRGSQTLHNGDQIEIGNVVLKFVSSR